MVGNARIILWDRAHLSDAVIRTGLYDWLVEWAGLWAYSFAAELLDRSDSGTIVRLELP